MISKSLNIISTYIWDHIFSIKTFVQFFLSKTQNFDSVWQIVGLTMAKSGTNNSKEWDQQYIAKSGTNNNKEWD